MGVGYQGLQLALLAKRRKVDFSKTVMLGRQCHYLDQGTLTSMFERFGIRLKEAEVQDMLKDAYSEGLFQKLGAKVVDSMDASEYEGANIIHDFNNVIPETLVRKYTCVIDFGMLEHVFNFPVALKNATDLLEVGGTLVSATTCNNFMGHGFYQFSPELFFNYLGKNGFTDIEVYMIPYRLFPYFFRVADPQDVQGRVELVNHEPMLMGVIARKAKHIPEMVVPIQSDYYNQFWKGRDVSRRSQVQAVDPQLSAAVSDFKTRLTQLVTWPETVSPHLVPGFENRLHYQLMDPARD